MNHINKITVVKIYVLSVDLVLLSNYNFYYDLTQYC